MARMRVLRKKEDIEKVPADQPVTIDTSEEEVIEAKKPDSEDVAGKQQEPPAEHKEPIQARKPEKEPSEEDGPDLTALQKRIEELTKAEKTQRERALAYEQQLQEQSRRSQTLEQEVVRTREGAEDARYTAILQAISAAEAEASSGQQAFEQASLNGDYKALADAQRKIARAEARLDRLQDHKETFEDRRSTAPQKDITEGVVKAPQSPQSNTFEDQIAALPESAKTWLREHPEYITDKVKNLQIQYVHGVLLQENKAAFSKGYFERAEELLGLRQPEAGEEIDDEEVVVAPQPRRSAPVSAPVSRDAPSASTGKPMSSRVTLSPEEREAAKAAGVDELTYAKNKLKLQQLKGNGFYREG